MALHPPTEDEETASGETPPVVAHGIVSFLLEGVF